MPRFKTVSGQGQVQLTAAEEAARDAEEAAFLVVIPAQKAKEISRYAEELIAAGTVINTVSFKTDTASLARLHGALTRAERLEAQAQPINIKFRTASGTTLAFTNVTDIGAVYDAATAYVEAVLAASADAQDAVEAMTPDAAQAYNVQTQPSWP